jgi:hypothetical protein
VKASTWAATRKAILGSTVSNWKHPCRTISSIGSNGNLVMVLRIHVCAKQMPCVACMARDIWREAAQLAWGRRLPPLCDGGGEASGRNFPEATSIFSRRTPWRFRRGWLAAVRRLKACACTCPDAGSRAAGPACNKSRRHLRPVTGTLKGVYLGATSVTGSPQHGASWPGDERVGSVTLVTPLDSHFASPLFTKRIDLRSIFVKKSFTRWGRRLPSNLAIGSDTLSLQDRLQREAKLRALHDAQPVRRQRPC